MQCMRRKTFSLAINLLITHTNASISKGDEQINKSKKLTKSLALKKEPANIAPRKVLPVSPINIFDGSQFQKTKPSKPPEIIIKVKSILKLQKRILKTDMKLPSHPYHP